LLCSCDKNDKTDDWNEPNDNHLIAGGWILDRMEMLVCETDNREAADLIYD
jgi:hypothetical protein